MWFGWAQENPRKGWRKYIGSAAVAALLVGLIGIYLSVTNWHEPTALSTTTAYHQYLLVVTIEFLLAGIGAFLLIKRKKKDYIAPWIAGMVGIHFFWLTSIFNDGSLSILAVLLIAVALVSLFLSKKLQVANSAITGVGSGTVLFGFAIAGWIRFLLV
ncbi:hypothetical protein [Thalassobacillus pellis]|uniref:hypothetical protein n=1 Tax=Thalassobacillus pellis TaxID=748008 RepID=UPI001EF864A6|nr:hypothetical protein [Thalassobacillus pellis]MBM7551244.1 apolipoprotein N-acyltransferase [Thalassobacillus pellis]